MLQFFSPLVYLCPFFSSLIQDFRPVRHLVLLGFGGILNYCGSCPVESTGENRNIQTQETGDHVWCNLTVDSDAHSFQLSNLWCRTGNNKRFPHSAATSAIKAFKPIKPAHTELASNVRWWMCISAVRTVWNIESILSCAISLTRTAGHFRTALGTLWEQVNTATHPPLLTTMGRIISGEFTPKFFFFSVCSAS